MNHFWELKGSGADKENLFNNQEPLSLMIISVISSWP